MKKFLTKVFLLFFVLLVGYFFYPINVLASSCQVSLSTNSISSGQNVSVNYSGSGALGDRVDLYIEKYPDGGEINPSPGTVSLYQGVNYYKAASCSVGQNCQSTISNLPLGKYYVNCNVLPSAGACSGNPFCTYSGGSTSCPGWNDCGTNDLKTLSVVATCAKCSRPGMTFQESEVFHLNSASQVKGFFRSDLKSYQTGALPSSVSFSGSAVTLKDERVGIAIDNPLKNEPFYKVEVTLVDANQQNLTGYLTMIDTWWSPQPTTNGFSVGMDTNESKSTYWWWHTQFKTPSSGVTQAQYDWSKARLNRFLKRTTGDVKLEVYVTPNGTYPVVNGANFGSFPDLYIGSYTFRRPTTFNYLVLNKYNIGGDAVTFKDLRVIKLDNSPSTVEDVNAYFIQKTLKDASFQGDINSGTSTKCWGYNSFDPSSKDTVANSTFEQISNSLWAAFLYRGYDYYFNTNHTADVRRYADIYINDVKYCLDHYLPKYGSGLGTVHINHAIVNKLNIDPYLIYGLSSYLTSEQKDKIRSQYERLIDKSEEYIKIDPNLPADSPLRFPEHIWYKGDTYAEETAWLLNFYTGFYLNFSTNSRSTKLLDYITFLGFLTLSTSSSDAGSSIREVYGNNVQLPALGSGFLDFKAKYIWPDGKVDNHDFHPSPNYGQSMAVTGILADNLLKKKGINIPTLTANASLAYQANVKNIMDISTFKTKSAVSRIVNGQVTNVSEDYYNLSPEGYIIDFVGTTNPSRVEDWASPYNHYHVVENFGDFDTATTFAKNVYYSFNSGSGTLFCSHVDTGNGQNCSFGTNHFYNFFFSDPLFAMLFSNRSNFISSQPLTHMDISNLRQLLAAFTNIFDYNQLAKDFGR